MTYPRRTSQAARYCRAPLHSYSFSIEAARPGAGGRAGWQRRRAWMLVFSSALRMWSLGPRGTPCHMPAYRSRIGPALAAKWGSRGKIQYLYRHGLMASVSRIRHTVLRLIGVPSTVRTRAVTSARDCRLSGCLVSATSSQATALTRAWSRGGKSRLAAPSWLVVQGKVSRGPTVSPPAHRTRMELHPLRCLAVGHQRMLRQEQDQGGPLPQLVRHRPLPGNRFRQLQEWRWELRPVAR